MFTKRYQLSRLPQLIIVSLIFGLTSCSFSKSTQDRNLATYFPRTQNCAHRLIDLAQANVQKRGIIHRYINYWKFRRPAQRRQNIEEGLNDYRRAIWDSHDNKNNSGLTLAGDSPRRSKFLAKVQTRNRNRVIPAYYQFWDGKESFETIDNIVRGGDQSSEEASEALKLAEEWLAEYGSYEARLNSKIDEGFEAILQQQAFVPHLRGGDDEWTFDTFRGFGVKKEFALPRIIDGKFSEESKPINKWTQWQDYIRRAKNAEKHIFSRGFIDETNLKSDIYQLQIEQYHMYRRLTFLFDKLDEIPKGEITPSQQALKDLVEELLKKGELYPPSHAVEKGQKAEIAAEIKAHRTRASTKNKIRSRYKQNLTQQTLEAVEETERSAWQIMRKHVFLLSGVGIGLSAEGIYTSVPALYNNPYISLPRAYLVNGLNNFILDVTGNTYLIAKCADEHRNWTKQEICVPHVIEAHTSRLFFQSQIDPTYDYLKDPVFIETRQKVLNTFLTLQANRRYLEFHAEIKNHLLEIAIPQFADEVYFDLLRAEFDLDEGDAESVIGLLDVYAIEGRTQSLDASLESMKNSGQSAVAENLFNYFSVREQYIEHVKEYGRIDINSMQEFYINFEMPPISDEVRRKLDEHIGGGHHNEGELDEDANSFIGGSSGRGGRGRPQSNSSSVYKRSGQGSGSSGNAPTH